MTGTACGGNVVTRLPVIIEGSGVEVLGEDLLAARESVSATHKQRLCQTASLASVWKFYLKFLRPAPGDLIIFGISGSLVSERTHHLRAQDLRPVNCC
jgi:hypothetical protein